MRLTVSSSKRVVLPVRKIPEGEVSNIPEFRDCSRGCTETIVLINTKVKVPVQAVLNPNIYYFQNTGNPHMLRVCPKCHRANLIILRSRNGS